MTFAGVYGIVVGLAMIGQWSISLARNQVPELRTEPIRIKFHIVAELITALASFVGGLGLLLDYSWGLNVYVVAIGMLLYTAIVSPGYFAQKGQWPMMGFFAVVIILALISLVLVL
jgi:hypothetical protein